MADDSAERLGRLFDAHHRRLFGLACRMTGDREDARDLVQETFVRAARSHSLPEDGSPAEAWLVQVLVRLCHDRRRRLQVRERHAAEARSDTGSTSIPDLDLWRAVAALPARQRAVIVLHEVEGHEVASVASLLGVSPVTVRWHLGAARRRLRSLLEGGNHPS